MQSLSYRGHTVELVEHREIIDRDATIFHQFVFAVDGKLTKSWEIPKYHRLRFATEDAFNDFLARSAVAFSISEYNVEGRIQ